MKSTEQEAIIHIITGKVILTRPLWYVLKEIPVQAGEMPLLQWLSFQNILPVPNMKRSTLINESQKPKYRT